MGPVKARPDDFRTNCKARTGTRLSALGASSEGHWQSAPCRLRPLVDGRKMENMDVINIGICRSIFGFDAAIDRATINTSQRDTFTLLAQFVFVDNDRAGI